ncbi:MAG: hypothetical protein HC906_19665 [Bacteroidales bacterium]|nr:hypothetical protein [Bacteroidales bacterium]
MLKQEIVVTAFDSGLFYIPPVQIMFKGNGIYDTIETTATYLQVNAFPLDTTGTIRDIKGIEKVPVTFSELLPYIGAVLFIGLVTWFIIVYNKKETQ